MILRSGTKNYVQNVKGVQCSPTLLKEIDFLERRSHSRYGARVKTYLFDEYNTSMYKAAKVKAPPDDPNSYVIKYYLDGTKYYINRDFNACLNMVTITEAYLKGIARPTLLCPFKKDNPEDD
ncbi:hypothetical protein PPL_04850 [Heterostelium album PN500]|uniref:Uncharacterized protein n=1 Tax=Heterostelium pallidum (strain ATCC 26659 / Pp 5 / PN500) TaxID=670386 RepID=D3B8Q7_HETP5|nr:hypothetical protein PPL_04850 [Heterostelium album PN500]EFA82425.1 hypothetical protein PPL_04850 [Heterostelium album PN500]|eukprot:XP_020434542.1 hypothetical protein PPL_04850 [Heterostelium album PN500]